MNECPYRAFLSESLLPILDSIATKLSEVWSLQIVSAYSTVFQTVVPRRTNCISIIWNVYSVQIPRPIKMLYLNLQCVISKIPGDFYADKVRELLDYVVTSICSTLKLVISHRLGGGEIPNQEAHYLNSVQEES